MYKIIEKRLHITYKDNSMYSPMVNVGTCVYDCNELIGVRDAYTGKVTIVSKSLIKTIEILNP